jgi:hypothetical protein
MTQCYTISEWSNTDAPLFKNVKKAYVLTMNNSHRIHSDRAEKLQILCSQTFVQYNAGWKHCEKDAQITSSALDLVDAYRNLFEHCKDVTEPILVLEDDAILLGTELEDYARVDEFIDKTVFHVYSLGSLGMTRPFQVGYHRKFVNVLGFSQALIWSRQGRNEFLSMLGSSQHYSHMDVHFVSSLKHKYTYYKPMVVQVFPDTENRQTWCFRCKNEWFEMLIVDVWINILKVLKLSEDPSGWTFFYHLNNHTLNVLILLSVIVIVLKR